MVSSAVFWVLLTLNFLFCTGVEPITMLWYQVNSEGTQPSIYMHSFSPQPPSHPGWHITLSRVPLLYNRCLLVIHFKYSSVYMTFPKSLTISKELKLVNPKGNQPSTFIGRTDAEAQAPTPWPSDVKSRFTGKDSDAGKDRG